MSAVAPVPRLTFYLPGLAQVCLAQLQLDIIETVFEARILLPAMFLQQLARDAAEAKRETERLANDLVLKKMEEFKKECQAAAKLGKEDFSMAVEITRLCRRASGQGTGTGAAEVYGAHGRAGCSKGSS